MPNLRKPQMLKQLIERLFPARTPHEWVERDEEISGFPYRTCSVCGREEELDLGSGMCGPVWMMEVEGDKTKHLIAAPQVTPDALPAVIKSA